MVPSIADVRLGSLIAMNLIFFVPVSIMAMVSPYIIGITACWGRQSGFTGGMVLFISTVGSFADCRHGLLPDQPLPVSRIIVARADLPRRLPDRARPPRRPPDCYHDRIT
jgi:hypothetical protein